MPASRYSIRFLFRCFLIPSYLLLVYVFLSSTPPKANTSDTPPVPFLFTAYIPVSSRSLRSLNILLEPFASAASPHLARLILVCPEDLVPQFQLQLAQVIKQEAQYHPDANLDFSLRPIRTTDDLEAETFALALEASTDWVLIMDENGIDDLSESTLSALRDSVFFDYTSPGPYDFVSPTFANETTRSSIRYWQNPYAWKPPLLVPTSSLATFIPPRDTIVFLLPHIDLIKSASRMICGLLSQCYTLRFLLYDRQHILSAIAIKSFQLDLACCSTHLTVHQTQQQGRGSSSLLSWLSQPPFIPKILFSVQEDKPLLEGLLSTHKLSTSDITRIYIPSSQYIYTDWIGSLSILELSNWHIPQITFSLITHTRPQSFKRLLRSLSSALYFGDDTEPNLLNVNINIDSSADPETKSLAQSFPWLHGSQVQINQRVVHGGLLPAIVESWYPHGNDSYGLLLEDDVELSPLFYAWVKMSLLKYRYGDKSNVSPNLFGISLYQQKHLELPPEGRRPFNARDLFSQFQDIQLNTPYLSSIPCSWGAIYFPEHWREFHDYLSTRIAYIHANHEDDPDHEEPIVPDVRSNRWTHSWKKFFIELVYLRGYVMLYPNYADFASLSTNHLEAGLHVRRKISLEKRGLFVLPLIQLPSPPLIDESVSTGLLDLPSERLPDFGDLPVLNLTGSLTTLDSLIQIGQERAEHFNAF